WTYAGCSKPHSITSSARGSNVGGTVRPSAFAVLRLINAHAPDTDGRTWRAASPRRPPSRLPRRGASSPQRPTMRFPLFQFSQIRGSVRHPPAHGSPVARVVASQILAPSSRARRITACDSRESSKSICKEIALQRPKSGKFDYLCAPSHSAHSMVSEFFTGDEASFDAPPAPQIPTQASYLLVALLDNDLAHFVRINLAKHI